MDKKSIYLVKFEYVDDLESELESERPYRNTLIVDKQEYLWKNIPFALKVHKVCVRFLNVTCVRHYRRLAWMLEK